MAPHSPSCSELVGVPSLGATELGGGGSCYGLSFCRHPQYSGTDAQLVSGSERVGSHPPAIHLGLGWEWFLQPPFLLQILLHPALERRREDNRRLGGGGGAHPQDSAQAFSSALELGPWSP